MPTAKRVVAWLLPALLLVGFVPVAAAAPAVAPAGLLAAGTAPNLTFTLRGTNFGQPVLLTASDDPSGRVFVADKAGLVRSWVPGSRRAVVYLDLRSKVATDGERGLLGIAFYPGFQRRPRVYISYVGRDGALKIAMFALSSADQATINPATEKLVLSIPHPTYSNHNGGMIAFSPSDHYLYISTGDGGGGGDPLANAQSRSVLSGKMLRIDVSNACGRLPYCSPASNPFHTAATRREIWAYGLRNPWRFGFDAATGDLWIGDVGQDAFEEVDHAAVGVGGQNYGWSCREATSVFNSSRCVAGVVLTAPVVTIPHPSGESVIGGPVYRGTAFAAKLTGSYVFGDFVTGRVWVRSSTGIVTESGSLPSVTSITTDQQGEIWATTLDGNLFALSGA